MTPSVNHNSQCLPLPAAVRVKWAVKCPAQWWTSHSPSTNGSSHRWSISARVDFPPRLQSKEAGDSEPLVGLLFFSTRGIFGKAMGGGRYLNVFLSQCVSQGNALEEVQSLGDGRSGSCLGCFGKLGREVHG